MKKLLVIFFMFSLLYHPCDCQYNKYGLAISGGTGFYRYIGHGEGDNYFNFSNPYKGYQFELIFNNMENVEWIIYGIAHYNSFNHVAENKVPVSFWMPYYTEFLFYQSAKTHPLFIFFGYDNVRMKFPGMDKPDIHNNITIGTGWNFQLSDRLYLQFKLKPYFIIDNSIGQWFGFNALINLHFGITEIEW